MFEVAVGVEIWAPCQRIWQDVVRFDRWYEWHDGMACYETLGHGSGAARIVTAYDGNLITEQLESVDEQAHRLTYAATEPARTEKKYISSIDVTAIERSCCELRWRSRLATDSRTANQALDFFYHFFRRGITGLRRRHEFAYARPSAGLDLFRLLSPSGMTEPHTWGAQQEHMPASYATSPDL